MFWRIVFRTSLMTLIAASGTWGIVQLVGWQNDRAERLLYSEQERSIVELQHETLDQAFNAVYSDLLFLCNQSLTISISARSLFRNPSCNSRVTVITWNGLATCWLARFTFHNLT